MSTLTFKTEKKISQAKNIQTTEYQFTYTPDVPSSWGSTELTPDSDHQTVYRRERLLFDNGTYGSWGDAIVHARYVPNGKPADLIAMSLSSESFIRDMRKGLDDNQIIITFSIQGKYSKATIIVTDNISGDDIPILAEWSRPGNSTIVFNPKVNVITNLADSDTVVAVIPYINTYTSINVTLQGYYTEGADEYYDTVVKILNVDDQTSTDKFIGSVSDLSVLVEDDSNKFLDGDYFVAAADGLSPYIKGSSYIRVTNGAVSSWVSMPINHTTSAKYLTCLDGLREKSVDLKTVSDANVISWFKTIITDVLIARSIQSDDAYIKQLLVDNGVFENLQVTGLGKFSGSLISTVFETKLESDPPIIYTAGYGTTTEAANDSTYKANAFLGKHVKDNIMDRANGNNGATALDRDTYYSASGTIPGLPSFSYVRRIPSVSSSRTNLSTNGTWTNPHHKTVRVKLEYSPVTISYHYSYSGYTYSWVSYGPSSGTMTSNKKPTRTGNYTPESWLDASNVGDVYYEPYITSHVGDIYEFYWVEFRCEAESYSGTEYDSNTGSVTVKINGSNKTYASGSSIDLSYNDTLTVTCSDPTIPSGVTVDSTTGGSRIISWVESDNFSTGLFFFSNTNQLFSLGSMSDSEIDSNMSLTINNVTWISITLNAATSWTYRTQNGAIYKLFSFAWTSGPSGAGEATSFASGTSITATDTAGSSRSVGSVAYISYNTGSLNATGTSDTLSFSSTKYYRQYSVDLRIIQYDIGVYTKHISPYKNESDTYKIGQSSTNRFKEMWAKDFYGEDFHGDLTGSVSGQVNTEATRLDNDKKVWGAVFN